MAKGTRRGFQKGVKVEGSEKSEGAISKLTREIIKEANELYILTGAKVALTISSPSDTDDAEFIDQSSEDNEEDLIKQLSLAEQELEKEKKRGEVLKQKMDENKRKYWWANPIDSLELPQLEELLKMYLALQDKIAKEVEKRTKEGEASSSASAHDSVNSGIDVGGVAQGGGSSMSDGANAVGASKMKAKIDG